MKSNGRGYLAKAGRDIVKEKRCDMEHRVKVTVLDKKLFFIEMMSEMITGIWEQVLW